MQDSRTPRLVEHFWVPTLGASCSNKLFVGTLRPSCTKKWVGELIFRSVTYLLCGSQRWGIEGEVKRGEVVWESEQGLKWKEGEMREKGWEERGPKAHEKL